jgi:ATP-dependent RNA helicase DeaD
VAPMVRQVQYEVLGAAKPDALMRLLDLEEPDSAIIFVRTRRDADVLAEQLSAQGYLAQAIHGEISQAQRERTLDRFREKRTQILVATDVAARGLDIPEVSHIINYDMPFDAESYVHRIGRTGRAGRSGEAITLVTPRERRQLQAIEHAIHRRIERLRLPTPADVAARRRAAFREEVLRIVDAGQLDPYLTLVEDLAGTRNPTELAAAAFKLAAEAREGGRSTRRSAPTGAPAGAVTGRAPLPASGEGARGRGAAPAERGEASAEGGASGGPAARTEREHGRAPTRRLREHAGPAPSVRLVLRLGKRQGVRPTDIVGAIANEAGIPGDAIGDIDIYDTFAFVEVPQSDAEYVRAALNGTLIRGRRPEATLAQPGTQRQELEAREERGVWEQREERRGAWGGRAPTRADGRASRPPREEARRPKPSLSTAKGRRGSARAERFPAPGRARHPGATKR